jgi:hypothetical protein
MSKEFKKFKEKERTRTVYEQAWIRKDETALSERDFGTSDHFKIYFTLIKEEKEKGREKFSLKIFMYITTLLFRMNIVPMT